ncbi:MAG: RidA family protein, partial [Planctomycetaceae bacterium]|nr:RidA family protein [Planctomycetaceae bacterium]
MRWDVAPRVKPIGISFLAILLVTGSFGRAPAEDRIRIERVALPTNDGATSAVRVINAPLVHTTQLLPDVGTPAGSQSDDVLAELDHLLTEHQSKRSDVVKLNLYVRDSLVREAFLKKLSVWTKGKLPAVACVATRLPMPKAEIALDAVFISRRSKATSGPPRNFVQERKNGERWAKASLLPLGDVVYVSGQAQPGELAVATQATLVELQKTLKHLGLDKRHIIQVKCFLNPMDRADVVNRQIAEFFGENIIPPVSLVEWNSGSLPIEIELIAWAPPEKSTNRVTYITPPWMKSSPVFSRVARLHGNDRIYISGLYSTTAGDGEHEVQPTFEELQSILEKTQSDMRHLVKATYYVSNDDASSQLNRLRPKFYDPKRPPAASKAVVNDVGISNRHLTIDMIAVPIMR